MTPSKRNLPLCLTLSCLLSACVVVDGDDGVASQTAGTEGGSDSDPSATDSATASASDSAGSISDSASASASDSGADSTGTGSSGAEPQSGIWEYDGGTLDDGCGLGVAGYEWGGYMLTNNGDGTFTATTDDEEFDCELDGGEFFCPDRIGASPPDGGADATVTVTLIAEGVFDSPTSGSGTQVAEASCEGPDCSLYEQQLGVTFPCSASEEFTTSLVD